MKKTLFLLMIASPLMAQQIEGRFKNLKNTEMVLTGYEGMGTKELAKTISDSVGNFILKYPEGYKGAAMLQPKTANGIIVLLQNEQFAMQWDDLQDFNSLKFSNSPENEAFAKIISLNQETEPKLAALKYLVPLYQNEAKELKWLTKQIAVQENRFPNFVKSLPKNSYAPYYLQLRKLVSDFPQTANRYIERLPQHEIDFKNIDFNDDRLWASGLMAELLDGFYQLMESHGDPSKVIAHCNQGTDAWIKALASNPTRQQEVAEHCFKFLEKRSLFGAAEHLAVAMLGQQNCQLDEKRTNLFEQYRKMALGNTAPDLQLDKENYKSLKEVNSRFKLVVFGASECPACQNDYPKLLAQYENLKKQYDLEVAYISIDTDAAAFEKYYGDAPFITFCDTKGWETQAAKDYHVFATPTYFLLSRDLRIEAKINSPEHLEAWLKVYGN